jgi:hypothetical protein
MSQFETNRRSAQANVLVWAINSVPSIHSIICDIATSRHHDPPTNTRSASDHFWYKIWSRLLPHSRLEG